MLYFIILRVIKLNVIMISIVGFTQHKNTLLIIAMFGVAFFYSNAECHCSECHYAECHYDDFCGFY